MSRGSNMYKLGLHKNYELGPGSVLSLSFSYCRPESRTCTMRPMVVYKANDPYYFEILIIINNKGHVWLEVIGVEFFALYLYMFVLSKALAEKEVPSIFRASLPPCKVIKE